jgi:hypothetical protein
MIQLLPINDTSVYNMWWDSYPYNAISVGLPFPLQFPSPSTCIFRYTHYLMLTFQGHLC